MTNNGKMGIFAIIAAIVGVFVGVAGAKVHERKLLAANIDAVDAEYTEVNEVEDDE